MELQDMENSTNRKNTAVHVRNCIKSYASSNSQIVLNNFSMTVPEGTVYGLLGSSGCGKTTLMKCLVGVTEIDSGLICLKYNHRRDIGYMPETLSLQEEMTVMENFKCYGYLFGMKPDDINRRVRELISVMNLPESVIASHVNSISGGQQRRVSLAVALLHDPKIIILDEPIVGLDPVICESIWDYLLHLAENGKTIILSTNYTEQAQRAQTIGLMRNGVLLAEASPDELLNRCETRSLEDAFLTLCQIQENDLREISASVSSENAAPQHVIPNFEDNKLFSTPRFRGALYKNLLLLKRSRAFPVLQLFIPILVYLLLNVTLGRKLKNLKIGVVNRETTCSNYSTIFRDNCSLTDYRTYSASCSFSNYLKQMDYPVVEYSHYETAVQDARQNKIWTLIQFPENFTSCLFRRILDRTASNNDTITNSRMQVWLDSSNPYVHNTIKDDLVRLTFEFIHRIISDCGKDPKIFASAIKLEKPIHGTTISASPTFAILGFLGTLCFYFPLISTVTLTITEKTAGITQRMQVAGASVFEIVFSLLLIQHVVHIVHNVFAWLIVNVIFDNPLHGSAVTLNLLMLISGTSAMLLGYLVGAFNNSLLIATAGIIGTGYFVILTSGTLWPWEGAHRFLKSVWVSPVMHTTDAIRAICLKGSSITDVVVLKGFAAALTWSVIFIFALYVFSVWIDRDKRTPKRKGD